MSYKPIGGRRGRSAAWQWAFIGFIPGLFCGLTLMVAVLLQGAVLEYFVPTPSPRIETTVVHVVLTATQDPSIPSPTPLTQFLIVTATPDPASQSSLSAPTLATPIPAQPASTAVESPSQQTTAQIPEILLSLRSLAVTVPGGEFTMGTTSEEVRIAVEECKARDGGTCDVSYGEDSFPAHQVTVDPFLMEITEVTFQQYVAFLNARGPNTHVDGCAGFPCIQTRNESADALIGFNGENYIIEGIVNGYPAYGMTWYGAREYCEAIGRRLPTEAEWERAARGEDDRIYPWGNEWDNALAKTNRPLDSSPGAFPVRSYPLGVSKNDIYDMAGNMAEWVSDWYGENHYTTQADQDSVHNPTGPLNGLDKVLRGGSWNSVPFFSRSVHRQSQVPEVHLRWIGFRCAADLDPQSAATAPSDLNPATIGLDVPEAPPQESAVPNAQPTIPPRP